MIFTTFWFLVMIAAFLPVYWLVRDKHLKMALLLAFCLTFHSHFAGASGMAPVMVLAMLVYFAGYSRNRTVCAIAIALCAFALGFYKYSHFFQNDVLAKWDQTAAAGFGSFLVTVLPETPPLAISFFTFEFVHYLMEVRRGKQPMRNFFDFMQFTIFFPSLVAGPIKRYTQFIPALHKGLAHNTANNVMAGFLQVLGGFFQKVVLADNLAVYISLHDHPFDQRLISERWTILIAIALRIYFDFNGYSEIAIGLARMMGIKLPANFNRPYLATSIRDFWQRWHISLSSWIRDYIYVPLGGSRHGLVRRIINGVLAFALCGLWHGAAWNFVVWGVYHGIGLGICAAYRSLPVVRLLVPVFERLPLLSWLLTILFVMFGWLLFFYPLPLAWEMFCLLFGDRV